MGIADFFGRLAALATGLFVIRSRGDGNGRAARRADDVDRGFEGLVGDDAVNFYSISCHIK